MRSIYPECGQARVRNKQGMQDNCQVAVSLSLASARGSLHVAFPLYRAQDWADDAVRRGDSFGRHLESLA